MATAYLGQYVTYEARLGSFLKNTKKRGSTAVAAGRAVKTLNWPHKHISPASLARAGFFFNPSPASPDQTVCFLCEKGLDGWEAGDEPLLEHLKHAPRCGWAIVAAIEAEFGSYGKEDPSHPDMIEARKATFAGRWPHDGKKGWKCKTKQLVEAGWKYTPTADSDDMATCTYCQLALDGWEPNDKPFDEHYNRSPDCPFFALVDHYKKVGKNSGRGKAATTSKASRLSAQSVGTVASEISDVAAGPEDSVLTTASIMSQQAAKKAKAKKTIAAKGSRKKVRKEEPSEMEEDSHQIEQEFLVPSLPPPFKAKRGKKRPSEAMEEPVMSSSEGQTSKKQAIRPPITEGVNSPIIVAEEDAEMADTAAPKAAGHKKGQASITKLSRKAPPVLDSHASIASLRAPPGSFPDDDEIERQLEADLARQFSDDEEIVHDSDSERFKARARKAAAAATLAQQAPAAKEKSPDYAMFDPTVPEPDDAVIEDELKALQAEMKVDDELEQRLHVPKKSGKAGTDRVSKPTQVKKSKTELSSPEGKLKTNYPDPQTGYAMEGDVQDVGVGSTHTVMKKTVPAPTAAGKRGRGRPSRASLASQASTGEQEVKPAEAAAKGGRGRPSKASLASQDLEPMEDNNIAPMPVKRGRGRPSKASLTSQDVANRDNVSDGQDAEPPAKRGRGRPSKKSIETKPTEKHETAAEADMVRVDQSSGARMGAGRSPTRSVLASQSSRLRSTSPTKIISPAPSARQPVLSPSQSPQSSDAENQPPSARPPVPVTGTTKRVVLVPVTASPMRRSPSKRNVIAGLQSTTPWTAANLEAIFGTPRSSPGKGSEGDQFLKRGRELTSPEKRMTVEEWIYYNAAEAEKKLKHECEMLVSRFESEGTRAIRVLEGLEVE